MPEFSNYQVLMLPALQALASGAETRLDQLRERVADAVGFTPEQRAEVYRSGATKLATQVQFALIGLERAGLINRVRRAMYRITVEGAQLLEQNPERIDNRFLRNYTAFVVWEQHFRLRRQSQPQRQTPSPQVSLIETTPDESMENAYREMQALLEDELLERIRDAEPAFLERVVVDLLAAMGYGGGDIVMGTVTGRPGDGGIDGTIREDPLGLDEVYIQAKRYARGHQVGVSDVRNFAGALDTTSTRKGVFVATSGFTRNAEEYVALSPKRIVLINGEKLARLLAKHGIGVRTRANYEIKGIDEDYFEPQGL